MKAMLAPLFTLVASPVLAHADGTLHAHSSDAVLWGLGLIAAATLTAWVKRKPAPVRR